MSRKNSRNRRPVFPPFGFSGERENRAFKLLLFLVAGIYLLTLSTVPVTNTDDQMMLTSAFNLIETGKLTAPTRLATKRIGGVVFGREALSGEIYAIYPAGYPLILALFLTVAGLAARMFGPLAADLLLCLPSILALTGTGLLIWRSALRLGYKASTAHCLLAGFGLGSYMWPYAGINWSEPAQVFFLTAGYYCLLAASQEEKYRGRYTALGSISLGFAVLIKVTLALLAAIFIFGLLWTWWRRLSPRNAILRAALVAAPTVLVLCYMTIANAVLFGSPLDFGYRMRFTGSLAEGLPELLVGSRKGIIFFIPLCILAPFGLRKLAQGQHRPLAVSLAVSALCYTLLIASWPMWQGGSCWGPRLLAPTLPALVLLAGAGITSRPWIAAAWILVACGIAVNSLGALIHYQAFYNVGRNLGGLRKMEPHMAQIPGHFWLLRVELSTPLSEETVSDNPLWSRPPWISKLPEAVPRPFSSPGDAILNPWPLRLLLPKSRWEREEYWYMRALLESAILQYERGNLQRALELMDRGLKLDTGSGRFQAAKGMVYLSLQDLTRALNSFDLALRTEPDYDLALYGRGMALEALGNRDGARADYERLLRLPPERIDPGEVQERLARLAP